MFWALPYVDRYVQVSVLFEIANKLLY